MKCGEGEGGGDPRKGNIDTATIEQLVGTSGGV